MSLTFLLGVYWISALHVEKMNLWGWVEPVKCYCLSGAAVELCMWGGLSLSWTLGSSGELISLRSLPAPCASVTETGWGPSGSGHLKPAVVHRCWQSCSFKSDAVVLCASFSVLLLTSAEHMLGRQHSVCSSGCCCSLWRKAEQLRLKEVWCCIHQSCAV